MAVTTLDARVVVDDADTTTGWTGGSIVNLTTPRAEGTNCIADQLNIATGTVYFTPGAALNLDTDLLYVQSYTNALQNGWKEGTLANSSHMLYMNDGTNELALCEAGDDRDVFKHANTQVQFQSFLIDLDYLATKNTNGEVLAIAGSVASFVKTSVDDVGSRFVTLSKALGGGQNVFVDIIRVDEVDTSGDTTTSTSGLFIYAGGSGTEGNFAEIVAEDESIAADKGHGIIREYTAGSYGCQGRLKFGTTDTLSNAYFLDSDFTLTFEDRDVNDDKYSIHVFGNSTNTNDFQLSDGTITSAGPGVTVDMSSNDIEVLQISSVSFTNLLNAISFPTDTVTGSQDHDVINNIFTGCGTVTPGTVVFDGNSFIDSNATVNAVQITNNISALETTISGYEGTAGTAAMLWNVNEDPNGNIDDSSFTMGTALTHAIEFGSSAPLTMTLSGCDFSGYSASNAVNNSTFLFADRGSDVTWTLNITGGSGNVTYRKARSGDTVNIIQDPVTTLINIKDENGVDEPGVAVYLEGTYVDSGSHTGANNASALTDSGQAWSTDVYVGQKVVNMTDGSAGTITANTGDTITATLAGGTDNDWDTSDEYIINANLPVDEPVSISRTGTLATVTHTAHGMNTGEYVKFSGITDDEADNSGANQITFIDANSYSYTSNNSGVLSYTGDIRATGATLYGTTDSNGDIFSSRTYTLNQPVRGNARKATTAPFYKNIDIDDTVDAVNGLTVNRRLVLDQ